MSESDAKTYNEGHRARLQSRFNQEPSLVHDYELLEMLLGYVLKRKDTKPLAKILLANFGGNLKGVFDAQPHELEQIKGIGPGVVRFWRVLRETHARYIEAPVKEKVALCTVQQVAAMARIRLAGCPHEEMWVALVNTQNRLLAWKRLSQGTINAAPFFPRTVLEWCLEYKAWGFILVHNHPGGNYKPSEADINMTMRMERAANEMGIHMQEHVIITDTEQYGIREQGFINA